MAKEEKTKIETDYGLVGGFENFDLTDVGGKLGTLTQQVMGGGVNIDVQEYDLNLEGYGGIDFGGDIKIGMRGDLNLLEIEAEDENDSTLSVDLVGDLMYATRAGGIVSSVALQAEALMMEGKMKLQGLLGYTDAPQQEDTGVFGQLRADYDVSKDKCINFMDKGCLTNIAQLTFGPDDGYNFRNEFLHDVNIDNQPSGFRVGPSIEYDSETGKVDTGITARVSFQF